MNGKIRWLYPAFWGLLMLATIRLAGDLYSKELFWQRPMYITLSEFIYTIGFGYLCDYLSRKQLAYIQQREESGKWVSKWLEYIILMILLSIATIVGVYVLHEYAHYDHDLTSYTIAVMMVVLCGTSMYVAIRNTLTGERIKQQEMQLEQMKSEHLETELQLLKSQYHPHFLFNALNTIYFQINEKEEIPRHTIEKLSDLLRYQLYTMDNEVDISQEIEYVGSYIDLMRMRKNESLKLITYFDESLKTFKIYPLLFQPLVENAFKYVGGDANYIQIDMERKGKGLNFKVQNSVPLSGIENNHKGKGLGIENLRKRLDLLYPQKYELTTQKKADYYIAQLTLLSL